MRSPETWRWIWLVATAVFAGGEMLIAGTFFLAPFAVGAVVATVLAFAGTDLWVQWAAFVATSAAAFAGMRPLARRLDQGAAQEGIGAKRLVGQQGTVLDQIPDDHRLGLVQVDREQWRAETLDGSPVATGDLVKVVDVQGTRLLVVPVATPREE
jgi:membrane protein implicated in regulation of membrane protease activity